MLNWTVTREDHDLIVEIAKRFEARCLEIGVPAPERMSLVMDLSACHANGTPLKLAELLAADDLNFGHDVAGIGRHIDRETGELRDCFCPRFAVPERD